MVLTSGLPPHSIFFLTTFVLGVAMVAMVATANHRADSHANTVGGSTTAVRLYRRAARCPTNSLKLVCRGGLPRGVLRTRRRRGGGRRASAFT